MSKARGADAESRACRQLERAGLSVVARNWRCRHGELDLVMRDGEALVFVEVRQRRQAGYGSAAASVDTGKQRRIIRAARAFVAAHPAEGQRPLRFDVVAIDGAALSWIRNAFDAE